LQPSEKRTDENIGISGRCHIIRGVDALDQGKRKKRKQRP
jgi:hypothetical protein